MCHQITYRLPCEHIRADIVYCADAPAPEAGKKSSSSTSSSVGRGSSGFPSKHHSSHHSTKKSSSSSREHGRTDSNKRHHHNSNGSSSSASSKSSAPTEQQRRRPCRNLTTQSIAYPLPPSFAGDPSGAAASPLLPKCPLARCPFEALGRCWSCCWCGKSFNEQGRCSCIMIIEGNQVRCDHICCETCTAAGAL